VQLLSMFRDEQLAARHGALEAAHAHSEGTNLRDSSYAAAVSGIGSPQQSRRSSVEDGRRPTSRAPVTRAGSVAGSVVAASRAIKCGALNRV